MQASGRAIAALCGLVASAFVLGRATSAPPASAPAVSASMGSPVRVLAAPGSVAHLDDADIGRIRDEVIAAMNTRTGRPSEEPAPAPTAPQAPPSPEQVAATKAAGRVIDDAVATGEWTDENVHALDAQFSAMPADARVAAGQRHAVAVNAGTIHVHFLGPLL